MTSMEYLEESLKVVQEELAKARKRAKEAKEDLALLDEDIKVIKSPKLVQSCASVRNSLFVQRKQALEGVKRLRVDETHINNIMKVVKNARE